jgi:hypothetical protein
MPKLSLSRAWDESRGVLQHDGKLLAIVALALIAFPSTIQAMVTPPAPQGELPEAGPWIAVAVVAILVAIAGQLAIIRLAVGPHTTVGEAIGHGARRTPAYVAAVIIWIAPLVLALVAVISAMKAQNPSAAAGIAFFALMLLAMFLVVRVIAAPAIASAEGTGPIAILRRSLSLTRGNWWRLFAFLLLFTIGGLCLVLAAIVVSGSIAAAIFGTPEPMSVGALIIALVTQVTIAAVSVVYFVMLARIYVQLAALGGASPSVPTTGT